MKYIYLDQNKWIDLSRAYHGLPEGRKFIAALNGSRDAISQHRAIFPISSVHIIELRKEKVLARRERLAKVMVELSRGWTIAPQSYILAQQIDSAIRNLFLGQSIRIDNHKVLGRGIPFAFGHDDDLHRELNISEQNASLLSKKMDTPKGMYMQLIGFDEKQNATAINKVNEIANSFALRVNNFRTLTQNYSKNIRRRAYIADLTYIIQDELTLSLSLVGKTLSDFFELGRDKLVEFFKNVPSLDIEIELATETREHKDRITKANDSRDLAFLAVAIPYCDIVVTENFWVSLVKRKRLDSKYNTVIISNLDELRNHLT